MAKRKPKYAVDKNKSYEAEVIDLRTTLINLSEELKFSEKLLSELNEENDQLESNFNTLFAVFPIILLPLKTISSSKIRSNFLFSELSQR